MTYRGATPKLSGKTVEIVYETCDGNNIPKYKIKGGGYRWYSGAFATSGIDREILLKEIKTKYAIWSGEGERGTREDKWATITGIKRILTIERCGGDRWAHACPVDDPRSDCCNTAREYEID